MQTNDMHPQVRLNRFWVGLPDLRLLSFRLDEITEVPVESGSPQNAIPMITVDEY